MVRVLLFYYQPTKEIIMSNITLEQKLQHRERRMRIDNEENLESFKKIVTLLESGQVDKALTHATARVGALECLLDGYDSWMGA